MRGFTPLLAFVLVVCYASCLGKAEQCHSSSCIEESKCPGAKRSNICPMEGDVCCAEVRDEDRHRCDHFGGGCMTYCNPKIQVKMADDCREGSVCCVLV